ncbi:MAG: helix-turn-helix transcriptional regulator [Rhodanobacteraceae bacterium]
MQSALKVPPNTTPLAPGDLVDEAEAAAILGCAVQTLRNWRWRRTGPRARHVGQRLVRYHRADLAAFAAGNDPA